ncbi:uncharacterized protein LAESUDRAFT_742405 [Laetiporus sulphureus 93-53]|uniref:Glycosyltransferase family 23 protein n=1 Tax=Laetiporus sulphureus 93-53 TaxID=1314785 RepID=A0A165FBV6_9APHY|nr:uncharacterized protein LAESUDRAFT_742405 [Laetiporus sulphureus 93-53]KZT08733.1 hypothetical protein LAESUDRAFT_742405 [Laetiporus sulphureus 93-53]
MPQPARPLANLFVSSSDYLNHPGQVLTPRTPHTRSGRAEEGRNEGERYEMVQDEEEDDPFFSTPGRSPPRGYRSRGDDHDIMKNRAARVTEKKFVQRYMFLAAFIMVSCILGVIYMTWDRAEEVSHTADRSTSHQVSSVPSAGPNVPSSRIISYENYTDFPLTSADYRHECYKLSNFIERKKYWAQPRNGPIDVAHKDEKPGAGRSKICSRTITYMLDGHVGLSTDLALMAQVAGLARERGSTLFVDDTYWNRGLWMDYFEDVRITQPGPEPGCMPPPPEELVACPRSARHWVVSSRTAAFHFGDKFVETFEDKAADGINSQRPIFNRATYSLTHTIRPNAHTAALIRAARLEIASVLSLPSGDDHHAGHNPEPEPYIGVHLRRGERTMQSDMYNQPYLPTSNYARAVRNTWTRLYPDSPLPSTSASQHPDSELGPLHFPAPPITYIATDSPEALREYVTEFPPATAVFALDLSTKPALRAIAPERDYVQEQFAQEPDEQRAAMTRGMLVDLALVSGLWAVEGEVVPGAVICTISSNTCKLSAFGLGWHRAFGLDDGGDHSNGIVNHARRRWVEIEYGHDFTTSRWRAFEIPA